MLSILFEQAINLDWQRDNPAKGIEKLKTGEGHKPWPKWAIEAYRKTAEGNDLLAFELALGTGQRISDVAKMKWFDIDGNGISVKQNKTGTELWILFTNRLRSVLAAVPRQGFNILADFAGRPLKYDLIQKRSLKIRKALGLEDYSPHGWRYTAAVELATTGATDAEIAAITGHKSIDMVVKYSRKNNQRILAENAQKRRDARTDKERTNQESGKQSGKLFKQPK